MIEISATRMREILANAPSIADIYGQWQVNVVTNLNGDNYTTVTRYSDDGIQGYVHGYSKTTYWAAFVGTKQECEEWQKNKDNWTEFLF